MTTMASARRRVVLPVQPAGPGAAAEQSWSARPKRAGEPRSCLPGASDQDAPKPAPARLSEGYLAATRQSAAAARTKAASIRAAAQERAPMPVPERSRQRPAAPPAGAVPGHNSPLAGATVVASSGLSVAEAARASTVAFRPLGRSADASFRQADLIGAGSTGAPLAPAATVLPPAEPLPRITPERGAQHQRFARTVAELERYQAAASPWEGAGAAIVPRPALARPSQGDATASPWSRLRARRKNPAAE
jgi:hypothetical protein